MIKLGKAFLIAGGLTVALTTADIITGGAYRPLRVQNPNLFGPDDRRILTDESAHQWVGQMSAFTTRGSMVNDTYASTPPSDCNFYLPDWPGSIARQIPDNAVLAATAAHCVRGRNNFTFHVPYSDEEIFLTPTRKQRYAQDELTDAAIFLIPTRSANEQQWRRAAADGPPLADETIIRGIVETQTAMTTQAYMIENGAFAPPTLRSQPVCHSVTTTYPAQFGPLHPINYTWNGIYTPEKIYTDCDVQKGMSGSPVTATFNDKTYIAGTLSGALPNIQRRYSLFMAAPAILNLARANIAKLER